MSLRLLIKLETMARSQKTKGTHYFISREFRNISQLSPFSPVHDTGSKRVRCEVTSISSYRQTTEVLSFTVKIYWPAAVSKGHLPEWTSIRVQILASKSPLQLRLLLSLQQPADRGAGSWAMNSLIHVESRITCCKPCDTRFSHFHRFPQNF